MNSTWLKKHQTGPSLAREKDAGTNEEQLRPRKELVSMADRRRKSASALSGTAHGQLFLRHVDWIHWAPIEFADGKHLLRVGAFLVHLHGPPGEEEKASH